MKGLQDGGGGDEAEAEVVVVVDVVVAARRACIRSVATIETPTIVKPRMMRGTQSLGNVQQSWPGWPRPEPRRAVAVSTLKPGETCSNSSRIVEIGRSGKIWSWRPILM